ncbi:MAG: sensor histidine kinase [Acidobacteria bacterium]|nr:sensor histidine kinase [Acidobacteriota bacterium]
MMSRKLPANGVFAVGYAVILLLLVFASLEAYSLLQESARGEIAIYKAYFSVDESVVKLRRALWLGSIYSRDYFLNPNADRDQRFRREIGEVTETSRAAVRNLVRDAQTDVQALHLAEQVERFLATIEMVSQQRHISVAEGHELVQSRVSPLRVSLSSTLTNFMRLRQEQFHVQEALQARYRQDTSVELLVLLAASLILGGLVALLTLRYAKARERERTLHFEEIVNTKQELERLSLRLLEVQEQERASLARELHDEVGQTLTALRMEISQALPNVIRPETRERLERAKALAEQTVQEVRDISLMLRPSLLDDLGLVPALQWQLESFSARSGIPVAFTGDGVSEDLPDRVRTCLYRIVQEAVHNCEKHAKATRLDVRLHQSGGTLELEVKDNGVGFPSSSAGRGSGILGMRERVSQLDGSLSIESQRFKGATIRIRIPVPVGSIETEAVDA